MHRSQNTTQRDRFLSVSLRLVSNLIGSKGNAAFGSAFHSNLTLTLELLHHTDDSSAPRKILPKAANIETAYCNSSQNHALNRDLAPHCAHARLHSAKYIGTYYGR
jgi:hypothetical protein